MSNDNKKNNTENIRGNKGEWSELYVLLKLMSDGILYAADNNLNKMKDSFLPIKKIFRNESDLLHIVFELNDSSVTLYFNGDRIRTIEKNILSSYARHLYSEMINGSNTKAFTINHAADIMNEIGCAKIKAPSTDKTDIQMQIYDSTTGLTANTGFSIKSEIGAAPSLLNASGATNFIYHFPTLTNDDMKRINDINTKAKVVERVKAACDISSPKLCGCANKTFSGNLMLIDSLMEDIIGYMLLEYYQNGNVYITDIVTSLEKKDPLGFQRQGIYRYKIKKFLCSIALGMMPSRAWDGRDEANGGYIIVKKDGEVLAYHLFNRDFFETYLLNNTKLETGSTTKHGFASIYVENEKKYMKLNLQIRFI